MRVGCGYPLYWLGCYRGTYDLIHPDSYSHPAKMAPALCFKIMEHLKELGLLKERDTVLDPMCGISTTGIVAGALGHPFIGVELESKFVDLSLKNKEYAERKLYKVLDWQVMQGDSRQLSELLKDKGLVSITSPPYLDVNRDNRKTWNDTVTRSNRLKSIGISYGESEGQIGGLKVITSPPYADQVIKDGQRLASNPDIHWKEWDRGTKYNLDNPDNIGNLKDKPLKSITSPPYQDSQGHPSLGSVNKDDWGKEGKDIVGRRRLSGKYGDGGEQIGNLKDKPLKSIMSPPYGDSKIRDVKKAVGKSWEDEHYAAHDNIAGYGQSQGQIGRTGEQNEQSESYLEAMAKVYQEIARVSDCLTVVVKNPTRNGRLRRLDLDTIWLLENCGFLCYCYCGGNKNGLEEEIRIQTREDLPDLRNPDNGCKPLLPQTPQSKPGRKAKNIREPQRSTQLLEGKETTRIRGAEALELAGGQSPASSLERASSENPRMANGSDEMSGAGQLHLSEVRATGILGASSEGMATTGRRHKPREPRSSLPTLSSENPSKCPQCGKPCPPEGTIASDWNWHILCTHRALLFEELEQSSLFGGTKKKVKGRLSFFKRLSYVRGQPVAAWEDCIFCVRKRTY